jgi:hypothetical protein
MVPLIRASDEGRRRLWDAAYQEKSSRCTIGNSFNWLYFHRTFMKTIKKHWGTIFVVVEGRLEKTGRAVAMLAQFVVPLKTDT